MCLESSRENAFAAPAYGYTGQNTHSFDPVLFLSSPHISFPAAALSVCDSSLILFFPPRSNGIVGRQCYIAQTGWQKTWPAFERKLERVEDETCCIRQMDGKNENWAGWPGLRGLDSFKWKLTRRVITWCVPSQMAKGLQRRPCAGIIGTHQKRLSPLAQTN